MATSDVQADFVKRFKDSIAARLKARQALSDAAAAIPRLKANASQASADIAALRADAKAAGVKLPRTKDVLEKLAKASGVAVHPEDANDDE